MSDDLSRLTQAAVLQLLKVSRSTLYVLRQTHGFPAPEYLAGQGGLMRWKESDVRAWMEARSTASPVVEKKTPSAPPPGNNRGRRTKQVTEPAGK